jgi:hypothetical protein
MRRRPVVEERVRSHASTNTMPLAHRDDHMTDPSRDDKPAGVHPTLSRRVQVQVEHLVPAAKARRRRRSRSPVERHRCAAGPDHAKYVVHHHVRKQRFCARVMLMSALRPRLGKHTVLPSLCSCQFIHHDASVSQMMTGAPARRSSPPACACPRGRPGMLCRVGSWSRARLGLACPPPRWRPRGARCRHPHMWSRRTESPSASRPAGCRRSASFCWRSISELLTDSTRPVARVARCG